MSDKRDLAEEADTHADAERDAEHKAEHDEDCDCDKAKVYTDKTPKHALTDRDMDALTEEEAEALDKPHFIKQWLLANVRHGESIACDVEPILDKNSNDIVGIAITPVDGVGILHIDC